VTPATLHIAIGYALSEQQATANAQRQVAGEIVKTAGAIILDGLYVAVIVWAEPMYQEAQP
jgi:hypothetical protein